MKACVIYRIASLFLFFFFFFHFLISPMEISCFDLPSSVVLVLKQTLTERFYEIFTQFTRARELDASSMYDDSYSWKRLASVMVRSLNLFREKEQVYGIGTLLF